MKKIILSLAVVATNFAFAQKKEIASAFKAIEAGDVSTANAQISAADNILGGKTYLLDPALLEQYYYVKGLSLLKSGKTAEGAEYLAKISDLGKNAIYVGKDSSKNKVYYVGKAAADASGVSGLKEEKYNPELVGKLGESLNPSIQAANKAAVDAYNAKKYSVAAPKFKEVYELLKAAGQDNKQYLYYAGLNYALADQKEEATSVYTNLINSGYTGVETTYSAKNASGEVVNLEKGTWDTFKKLGASSGYSDFKSETSKSIETELYETAAALLIDTNKTDQALTLIDNGLKKFPGNAKLTELQGTAYHKSGKTDEFVKSLRAQLQKDPKNKENWYNLGVLLSKDEATKKEAIEAYNKAVELDPKFAVAYQNLTYTTIGDDSETIEKYNQLRKAGKIEEANKVIADRRARLVQALPYAEKWYQADPKNIDAISLLKGIYQTTKNDAKVAEFKAKEEALKAGK